MCNSYMSFQNFQPEFFQYYFTKKISTVNAPDPSIVFCLRNSTHDMPCDIMVQCLFLNWMHHPSKQPSL